MEAAENEQNTFQMEPNPLALRRTSSGNCTGNPGNGSTDGRTIVASTTVNASFNAQPSDAGSANADSGAADDADGYEPPAEGYAVGTQPNGNTVYATYAAGGASAALTKDADGYVADDSINQANGSIVYAVPVEDEVVSTASPAADGYTSPLDRYALLPTAGTIA